MVHSQGIAEVRQSDNETKLVLVILSTFFNTPHSQLAIHRSTPSKD